MNILIASVDALPQMGGISLMGHHLANAFVDLGHEVVFVGPRGAYVPSEYRREYLLLEDFESQTSARGGAPAAAEDQRLRELFRSVFDTYRIDHVLLLHPFYYAVPLLDVCKETGARLSAYFHGYELRSQLRGEYPRHHEKLARRRQIGTLRERVFYTVAMCDEVLVNSRFTGKLLDGFAVKPAVHATGCGIPELVLERETAITPHYERDQKRSRRLHLGLPEEPMLSFVGRLVPTKAAHRLVEFCKESQNLSAAIIGDGPELERLQSLVDSFGLSERVQLLGRVSEQRKWDVLRASDFCCLMSEPAEETGHVEGFGIALLEGAAAGAIAVSSGTGGMGDVVEDQRTGLIIPPDANGAAVLTEAVSESGSARSLVSRARRQLRTRYNWRAVAASIASRW